MRKLGKGKTASYKRLQAQILLKADLSEEGPGWIDKKISEAFEVNTKTLERVRQRLIEERLEAAINRAKAKQVKSKRLDAAIAGQVCGLMMGGLADGVKVRSGVIKTAGII